MHFASAEDAEKALQALKTVKLGGRKVKAELAVHKNAKIDKEMFKSLVKETIKKEKPPVVSRAAKVAQPTAVLVVTFEKDQSLNKKVIYKKMRKFGTVVSLQFPFDAAALSAQVSYATVKDAMRARKKLDGHVFKGSKMSVSFWKDSRRKSQTKLTLKQHRLIVRNLTFTVTEDSLRAKFAPFGKIVEINVPMNASYNRPRGFGFVQYERKEDAALAMASLNGTDFDSRTIAVDWAVQKSLYEKLEEKESENAGEKHRREGHENVEESHENVHEEESNENVEDSNENEKEEMADSEESSTVFIRNLSFETGEEALRERLADFGPIEYCKIVRVKETGASKGTAFARFKHARSAKEACARSQETCQDDLEDPDDHHHRIEALCKKRTGKTAFHSILTEETALSRGVVLDGRALMIVMAVDKDKAKELSSKKATSDDPKDKRNLRLVKETLIRPLSQAAEAFWRRQPGASGERERMVKQRLKELQRNSNSFVSLERLSIRLLPTSLDEADLKKIMREAVRAALQVLGDDPSTNLLPEQWMVQSALRLNPRVLQVKIVRAAAKKDGDEQPHVGRSKGYGFVQWRHHVHALLVIRYLNNYDPQLWRRLLGEKFDRRAKARDASGIGGSSMVPILEFATEKTFVVAKRAEKMSGR